MKIFKDTKGREWTIVVDVGQIKTVRDLVGVDLHSLFKDEAKRVLSDPILLVDTLYALCRQQCAGRQMSDVDFGQSFDGDVLEAAANALLDAVIDFFPQSRRTILRATVTKSEQLAGQMQADALARIERLTVMDLLRHSGSAALSA